MSKAREKERGVAPEYVREYEQERLILEATDTLYGLMEDAGLSKADLARALNTSRAHVTQLFRGSRNMTLRTLADLAYILGRRVHLKFEPLGGAPMKRIPARDAERHRHRRLPRQEPASARATTTPRG